MPTDSPLPSPDINAPSPSTSSVSIEDLNLSNINFESITNTGNYAMISAMENTNHDSDMYVPTVVATNIKSYVTSDSYGTVQGMLYLRFADYYFEVYDLLSNIVAIDNKDQQSLTSQFPYDAPSPPPDETFTYSEFSNQTNNVSYSSQVTFFFFFY